MEHFIFSTPEDPDETPKAALKRALHAGLIRRYKDTLEKKPVHEQIHELREQRFEAIVLLMQADMEFAEADTEDVKSPLASEVIKHQRDKEELEDLLLKAHERLDREHAEANSYVEMPFGSRSEPTDEEDFDA